jgi:hypothetical protein
MTKLIGYLYHVTTPEIAEIILREGFKDHATTVSAGYPLVPVKTYEPGVWFADMPPIQVVGDDAGYYDHTDEAWIRIKVTPRDFDRYFAHNEILDDISWGTRQWLIRAAQANLLPRDEMPLRDVLAYRMRNIDRYGEIVTADFLRYQIEKEITDETIKARWLDALDAAVGAYPTRSTLGGDLMDPMLTIAGNG